MKKLSTSLLLAATLSSICAADKIYSGTDKKMFFTTARTERSSKILK